MNVECLISGVLMGIVAGVFCGLIIANLLDTNKIITVIITVVIFSLICTFGLQHEKKYFNNGYCFNCETKYQAIDRKNHQTYYECPECYFGIWH